MHVKFSPSVCIAVVASLTGKMAAQSYAYHAHGPADSDMFVRRMIEKKKKKLRNNYYQCSAYVGSNEPSKKKLRKPMLR